MALLAYTIFTTTLVLQRKQAARTLALGPGQPDHPARPAARAEPAAGRGRLRRGPRAAALPGAAPARGAHLPERAVRVPAGTTGARDGTLSLFAPHHRPSHRHRGDHVTMSSPGGPATRQDTVDAGDDDTADRRRRDRRAEPTAPPGPGAASASGSLHAAVVPRALSDRARRRGRAGRRRPHLGLRASSRRRSRPSPARPIWTPGPDRLADRRRDAGPRLRPADHGRQARRRRREGDLHLLRPGVGPHINKPPHGARSPPASTARATTSSRRAGSTTSSTAASSSCTRATAPARRRRARPSSRPTTRTSRRSRTAGRSSPGSTR